MAAKQEFESRFAKHKDELEWLFMELYHNREGLEVLEREMAEAYNARSAELKALDKARSADPEWYKRGNMFGMTMYTDLFAGNLKELAKKLPYLKEQKLTAGIIWLCRPVMHVMKSNYYYAWHFVPFLVLASTCSCFNQFMNSVYVVNKKSTRSMITMMAGAVSNCIMNYFFIKWWGPVGATYASFLGLGLVFTLRAIDAHGMIGMRVHPSRVLVNAAALVIEAFVLLAETPLYGLWTGIITALIILYNFAGVWAMARVLLPKLLGRRGKALVNVIDGWIAPKKA